MKNLKLASQETEHRTVVKVSGVEIGCDFVVIAGPCSVESEAQILDTARAVKSAGADMLRGGPDAVLAAAIDQAVADGVDVINYSIGGGASGPGADEIARRSRGTPRIANRLLRRVRDFAQVRAGGRISREIADQALAMLKVDARGFDHMDRRLLLAVIEKFDGGPVGVERGFVLHSHSPPWDSTLAVNDDISVTTSRDVLEAIASGSAPGRI